MIDFPNSPTVGEQHTEGDVTFEWDGTIWKKVRETEFGTYYGVDILDEDDMASNRADALATQQSIVAYVATQTADLPPQTIVTSEHTLVANNRRRLLLINHPSTDTTIDVPTDTFSPGDWFWIQPIGPGDAILDVTGITVNADMPTQVSPGGAMTVIFTAVNTISVFGGEEAV